MLSPIPLSWLRLPLLVCYQQPTSSSLLGIRPVCYTMFFQIRLLSDTLCVSSTLESFSGVLFTKTNLPSLITWPLSIINNFIYFPTAQLWDSIYYVIPDKSWGYSENRETNENKKAMNLIVSYLWKIQYSWQTYGKFWRPFNGKKGKSFPVAKQ